MIGKGMLLCLILVGFSSLAFAQAAPSRPVFFHNAMFLGFQATACTNAKCTSSSTTTLDAQPSLTGVQTQVVVPADGLPFLSYIATQSISQAQNLYVIKCGTPTCSSGNTRTLIAPNLYQQEKSIIRMNPATGFPSMMYRNATTQRLELVECQNPDCTGYATFTVGPLFLGPDWTYARDGTPLILAGNALAKCSDPHCSSVSALHPFTTLSALTEHIALARDGNPVISYMTTANFSTDSLHVIKCQDVLCISSTDQVVDTWNHGSTNLYDHTLVLGNNSLPILSYYDSGSRDLKVVACANLACSVSTATPLTSDPLSSEGYYNSLAFGANGFPIVGFWDSQNFRMGMTVCENRACTTNKPTRWFNAPSGQWVAAVFV